MVHILRLSTLLGIWDNIERIKGFLKTDAYGAALDAIGDVEWSAARKCLARACSSPDPGLDIAEAIPHLQSAFEATHRAFFRRDSFSDYLPYVAADIFEELVEEFWRAPILGRKTGLFRACFEAATLLALLYHIQGRKANRNESLDVLISLLQDSDDDRFRHHQIFGLSEPSSYKSFAEYRQEIEALKWDPEDMESVDLPILEFFGSIEHDPRWGYFAIGEKTLTRYGLTASGFGHGCPIIYLREVDFVMMFGKNWRESLRRLADRGFLKGVKETAGIFDVNFQVSAKGDLALQHFNWKPDPFFVNRRLRLG